MKKFISAKLSYASEFIEKLKYGYDTKIGENGIKLSGGENKDYLSLELYLKKVK